MGKMLESGEDKIRKICDALRRETLEPAKIEANTIIEEAKTRAKHILSEAQEEASQMIREAQAAIEREESIFHASLEQSIKQSMEELRQEIEHKLFHDELYKMISQQSADSKTIAKLLEAIIASIEKEGINTDLSAVIPKHVSVDEINKLLEEKILKKLKDGTVLLGGFKGGVQVKLHDKMITIDITDSAMTELVAKYVRKDFRRFLFKS